MQLTQVEENDMNTKTVDVKGMQLEIPDYYQKVRSMDGDPEDSVPFLFQTPRAACLLLMMPIQPDRAMNVQPDELVEILHGMLEKQQGLIEVKAGDDYIYSIVKDLQEGGGVQYILTFQKKFGDRILSLRGYFDEMGVTGLRESAVLQLCMQNHLVGSENDPMEGWAMDPYDPDFSKGIRMNLSEQEEFDGMFPEFPLSLCRALLKTVCESQNN